MDATVLPEKQVENQPSFALTESAARRIAYLAQQEENPQQAMLRIAVDGGGCSGFQYHFDFTTRRDADDLFIERGEARAVIDSMSLEFVNGSVLDYVEELGAAYFAVKNPNASASCGCGNSFAV